MSVWTNGRVMGAGGDFTGNATMIYFLICALVAMRVLQPSEQREFHFRYREAKTKTEAIECHENIS